MKFINFLTVKMGVVQKKMSSMLDHRANIFSISGAPMEHNATAKSKETIIDYYSIYFIIFLLKYNPKMLLYENLLHTPSHGEFF